MWFCKISKPRCNAKSVEEIMKNISFNAGVSNSIRMVGNFPNSSIVSGDVKNEYTFSIFIFTWPGILLISRLKLVG